MKRILGLLGKDEVRSYQSAANKLTCAEQAMNPSALSLSCGSVSDVKKFFREAIFAYADALYLLDCFLRRQLSVYNIRNVKIERHGIDEQNRFWIEFL